MKSNTQAHYLSGAIRFLDRPKRNNQPPDKGLSCDCHRSDHEPADRKQWYEIGQNSCRRNARRSSRDLRSLVKHSWHTENGQPRTSQRNQKVDKRQSIIPKMLLVILKPETLWILCNCSAVKGNNSPEYAHYGHYVTMLPTGVRHKTTSSPKTIRSQTYPYCR